MFKIKIKIKHLKYFFLWLRLSIEFSVLHFQADNLFDPLDFEQHVGEYVLVETQADPPREVEEGDESHEVVGVVGVVPGAGVELPQNQTPGELPGVDEADVDGEPPQGPPASAEVQMKVELLHHEAAAPIHDEGPQRRVSAEAPVRLLHQVEQGGEEHLIQEAVHPKEEEPGKPWQGLEGSLTSTGP